MNELLTKLMLNKNYNATDQKVLIYLFQNLEYGNRIKTFRQTEMAKTLKTSQPNISKSLKRLEKDEILKKKGFDYYLDIEKIESTERG